jgi:hypothetical protein
VPAKKPVDQHALTAGGFSKVLIRLPAEAVAQLDAWVDEIQAAHPGFTVTRTSVVRDIVLRALEGRE